MTITTFQKKFGLPFPVRRRDTGYSFRVSRPAISSKNASEVTARAAKPGSTRPTKSPVMTPSLRVSKQASSSFPANRTRSASPSSSPRFRRAPLQAKMVAMGLVEVFSPFR